MIAGTTELEIVDLDITQGQADYLMGLMKAKCTASGVITAIIEFFAE